MDMGCYEDNFGCAPKGFDPMKSNEPYKKKE